MSKLEAAVPDAAPNTATDDLLATPDWYPAWATQLAEMYFSGTTCVFVLHGNVHDWVRCPAAGGDGDRFVSISEFLATQVFSHWNAVLSYDLGKGLRAEASDDRERLQAMNRHLESRIGNRSTWKHAPNDAMDTIQRLITHTLIIDKEQNTSVAFLFPYAQYIVADTEPSSMSPAAASRLVRLLGWAQDPVIKRRNIAFVLITERLNDLNDRLVQNSHSVTIEVPMPDRAQRQAFVSSTVGQKKGIDLGDFTPDSLSLLSNGLNLVNLNNVLSRVRSGQRALDEQQFKRLKKTAIERQCQGLVEFVEPKHKLDLVVGHVAAKARLAGDARWLSEGHLDASPMGYLFCGPVGTGKTFLAECYAGSIGIPCVKLRNFRSKYVGETEGNLQQVLTVLRSLGPIVVMIDEADAMLGDRRSSGDSGTSGRVFSMIASQMGDTQYRGRIIWMLLTCRPDLLPIDLKRQGRAEVHIPLFYPQADDEIADMFRVMARKNGCRLAADAVPDVNTARNMSGADIESIVLAARRAMMTEGREEISKEDLGHATETFIPSAQGLEKELQEIVAVLECTDRAFLTDDWREKISKPNGRSYLQERSVAIRQILEE